MSNDKVRLIIEVDEEVYNRIKRSMEYYPEMLHVGEEAIANGTPVSTEGDLISRSALQKDFYEKCAGDCAVCIYHKREDHETQDHCLVIDNAQAVPERDYSQGWHDAITKALNEAYTVNGLKVVQAETLIGLGMSMPQPDKESEAENE